MSMCLFKGCLSLGFFLLKLESLSLQFSLQLKFLLKAFLVVFLHQPLLFQLTHVLELQLLLLLL